MKSYVFLRRLANHATYRLGTAAEYPSGWKFISNVASLRGSRKFHPTMEECLPRWLGYPSRCESMTSEEWQRQISPTGGHVVDPWRRADPPPDA